MRKAPTFRALLGSSAAPPHLQGSRMKTASSRFPIHDELTAPEASLAVLRGALATGGAQAASHLHEEAREAGWTDEELLEAIAYAALEMFTAMVNVAGDVPVDGSAEEGRRLKAA